jgi:V8-like Glu-specific endopeptidase
MVGIRKTSRQALLALVVAVAATLALLPGGAAASPGMERVDAHTGARAYWTPARMRAAEPVDPVDVASLGGGVPAPAAGAAAPSFVGPADAGAPAAAALRSGGSGAARRLFPNPHRDEITDPAAPEFRAHGKVFFTVKRGTEPGDYVCSGTAVNSRNRSVVWTAGHCIYDNEAAGGYSRNFVFVPGYKDGSSPYGEWPAKKVATTAGWRYDANIRYDLGAAVVTRDSSGRKLQNVVGATGIGFSQPRVQYLEAYGYPADPATIPPHPEFTGEREFRCKGSPFGIDRPAGGSGPPTTGIECDMSAGSSGGGWIGGIPRGAPMLLSVTSYGYLNEIDHLYGPYMAKQAKSLYKLVRGKRPR